MFVLNFRFSTVKRPKVIIAVAAVVVAVICVICMVSMQKNSVPDTATCDEAGTYSLRAKSMAQQCDFLKQFKINADENSAVCDEVTIPAVFNDTYEQYNNLQNEIGLDLNRYSGKTVQRVKYTLENNSAKYAVLLIYKDRIIGAHLTNGEYGNENMPLG